MNDRPIRINDGGIAREAVMYQAITDISADFQCLAASLQSPQRVTEMRDALEKTSHELETALAAAASLAERDQLAKIHRGILAARRLINCLHEMQRPPPDLSARHSHDNILTDTSSTMC